MGSLHFETYQDDVGEWRWRLRAVNGEIIATSSEGYTTEQAMMDGIVLVKEAASAPVEKLAG